MEIIQVNGLTKEYKLTKRNLGFWGAAKSFVKPEYETIKAVDNISFNIEKGKIVGFIGPNGAGKSTTIKMMVGILAPTCGNVKVNGFDSYRERKKNAKSYGLVFGQRTQLWWDIPIFETFSLLKEMYSIEDEVYKSNLEMFIEILNMKSFLNKPTRQLSLGQRMRADLCAALLHNPEVLFLDEPTIGLDISVKENIRKFILEVNKERNTTIILTTHDVSDIEQLSQEIMVIDVGRIIYRGNLVSLREVYGGKTVITIKADESVMIDIAYDLDQYPLDISIEGDLSVEFDKNIIDSTSILNKIFSTHQIKGMKIEETPVEEIIKNIYRHELHV